MNHSMKAGVLALTFLATALSAQSQPIELPIIGESIDVRVVNVEVVATSGGELVRGLTAADFRLLIDGKEVPIEFFTEVAEGIAAPSTVAAVEIPAAPVSAAEAVPRSFLVFIDESFSVAGPRDLVLENLEEDLKLMGPADQMAVLAFDGAAIDVLSPWTSDKAVLAGVLRSARHREARGNKALAQHRSLEGDEEWAVEAAAAGGLEGDELQEVLRATSMRISPEARTQLGKTALAMAGTLRGFELPLGRKVMLLLSGGWSVGVAPQLYGPVVSAANQLGYTIYPVDVASPTPQTLKMLDSVATQTGGRVANSVKQDVFRQVVADSGSYYWIGFSPSWKANDRSHSIRVEPKRPGIAVRARTGFPDLSKRTENARKAESVLLFGGNQDGRKLRVLLGKAKPLGRREIELAVTVGVPVEALALTPSGKGYIAEAPLAVAALDETGGRAEIPTSKLRVAVKEMPQAGGLARFQTVLRIRQAPQRLVFTVRDEVSGETIWQEVKYQP
ncbi:MAG TPA: VWA domain-containing protein [Thermoanaerobaculia bacterium]|nr:VWA domain-containing protein [Thermoanaerobaculia bacterium]